MPCTSSLLARFFAVFAALLLVGTSACSPSPDNGTPDAGSDVKPDAGDPNDEPDGGDDTPDGGDDETPDGGDIEPRPELPVEEFADTAYDAYCGLLRRCEILPSLPEDPAVCRQILEQMMSDGSTFELPSAVEASILAGLIDYDPAEGQACIDDLNALDCNAVDDDPMRSIESCQKAFKGKLSQNDRCITSLACGPGLVCELSEDEVCDGVCVMADEVGCFDDGDCENGEGCRERSGAWRCVEVGDLGAECVNSLDCRAGLQCEYQGDDERGTCRQLPGLGEACPEWRCASGYACAGDPEDGHPTCVVPPAEGETCMYTGWECGPGLFCEDRLPEAVCRPLPGEDELCSIDQRCAAGLRCEWDVASASTFCRAPRAENEACESNEQCDEGLGCLWSLEQERHICRPVPTQAGAPCPDDHCGGGLICAWAPEHDERRCTEPPARGEECPSWQCAEGLECQLVGDVPTCTDLPAAGEPCPMNRCAEGADCRNLNGNPVCVARPGPGEACPNWECAEGAVCIWDTSMQPVCVDLPGFGESCFDTNRCEPGLACTYDQDGYRVCDLPPAIGESCEMTNACGTDAYCDRPARGPEHQICTKLPGKGEPCSGQCADNLDCIDTDDGQVCVGQPGLDEQCSLYGFYGDNCSAGLICVPFGLEPGQMRCRQPKALGEACTAELECGGLASPLICDVGGTNTCVRRPGVGSPCAILMGVIGLCDPASAYCDVATGGAPMCEPYKQAGEECDPDNVSECGDLGFIGECRETEDESGYECWRPETQVCEP